jgi:hypothetical protein
MYLSKATAASGGARLAGLSASYIGIQFLGIATSDSTGKSTAASAYIDLRAHKRDGTGVQALGADANIVVMRDNLSTRFAFDAEGEIHSDAIIGVGNDWDEWDDIALASDLSRLPRAKWNEMMKYHAEDFERAGLLTLSTGDDGKRHAFIKHKALLQFYACCFREVGQRLARYERVLLELGADPALLEG